MKEDLIKRVDNLYTIITPMTSHGGMTVVDPATHSTYLLVGYDDDNLQEKLASQTVGDSVRLNLKIAGVRANVWRASRVGDNDIVD